MAIQFVGMTSTVNNSLTNGASVAIPAGSVNDLMLCYASNAAVVAYNALTNWTPVDTLASTKNANTALGVWYRYATGSDTAPTPAWTGATNACTATILRYSGVSQSTLPTAVNRHAFASSPASTWTEQSIAAPDLAGELWSDWVVDCWALGQRTRTGGSESGTSIVSGSLEFDGGPGGFWTQRGNNTTGNASSTGPTRATGSTSWNCGVILADRFLGAVPLDLPTVLAHDGTVSGGSGGRGLWMTHSVALAAAVLPPVPGAGLYSGPN
jgi:hypothetical protein